MGEMMSDFIIIFFPSIYVRFTYTHKKLIETTLFLCVYMSRRTCSLKNWNNIDIVGVDTRKSTGESKYVLRLTNTEASHSIQSTTTKKHDIRCLCVCMNVTFFTTVSVLVIFVLWSFWIHYAVAPQCHMKNTFVYVLHMNLTFASARYRKLMRGKWFLI